MIASSATLDYSYPPEIVAPVGTPEKLRPRITYVVPPYSPSVTGEADSVESKHANFAIHFSKLKALALEQALWPDDADPPGAEAVMWAQLIVQQLQTDKFLPTRVVASAEGGVGICFVDQNKYADIECLNSGAILGVLSNKRDRPIVWEIEPDARSIARATERIRAFINP